jgi:putative tryptophan/tyrosine transport system ATP-binding protein
MELIVTGLDKRFQGVDGEPDFHLELPQLAFPIGELVFLMGHNGSGKSVTVRLLSGEMQPTAGRVCIRFTEGDGHGSVARCSVVRQNPEDCLAGELTVRQNMLLRLNPTAFADYLCPYTRLKSVVSRSISKYSELSKKIDQPCRNLSTGQRQILAFLSVAAVGSPLLLLDEFLSAADTAASLLLRNLACEYARSTPACVVIVSHTPQVALDDGDRILILRAGKLVRSLSREDGDWNVRAITRLISSKFM